MKEFRTKEMSIKIRCCCVSVEYFSNNFRNYYDFIGHNFSRSKVHGTYIKFFYKLKPLNSILLSDIDEEFYSQLPPYICKSTIY